MTLARWCRRSAWIVVALAILDPAVPIGTHALPRVIVISNQRAGAGDAAFGALQQALAGHATVEARLAPGPDAYVLIADRYPVTLPPLPADAPVHVLSASRKPASVTLRRATAPARALLRLPVAVMVDVERHDDRPDRTRLHLVERGATLATAEVAWRAGQRQARVALTFVPSRTGPVRLRVTADHGPQTTADVLTNVSDERFNVRVTGARASWALAFAAAALRDDDRLIVSSRIQTSPGRVVAMRPSGIASGSDPDVELRGVGESLDAADAADIRRAAERGAVVVLVPDRGLPAAARELAGVGRVTEHVSPAPVAASSGLRAGEWLLVASPNPASTALGSVRVNGRDYPLAVDLPVGAGRVVLVTALDAWRYRADTEYSRFWRTLVIELAARQFEARARLHVAPAVVRPGEPLTITYEAPAAANASTITVVIKTGGNRQIARTLVPTGGGTFTGRMNAPLQEGVHEVSVDGEGAFAAGSAYALVARDASVAPAGDEPGLRALAEAHGGVFARDAEELAGRLRASLAPRSVRDRTRPMRWPAWPAIVALLLGTEWWARRRNGLR